MAKKDRLESMTCSFWDNAEQCDLSGGSNDTQFRDNECSDDWHSDNGDTGQMATDENPCGYPCEDK